MHKTRWYPQTQQKNSNAPSNPIKTDEISLDSILNGRCEFLLQKMQAPSEEKMTPPANRRDFEARITKYEEDLRDKLFGYLHYLKEGKTLKRDSSVETIVEFLCEYDKHANELCIISQHYNGYSLLKQILEKDAPFVICQDTYLLGFERDRSGLSVPQKNVIAVQAAAQTLWHLEKTKFPTIESMTEYLFDKECPFYAFLDMDRFHNRRTIQNWISEIFPIPNNARKGRPSHHDQSKCDFKALIPIPGIFLNEARVINVMKLRFAIQCLVRVLKVMGWPRDRIERSPLIRLYQTPLKYYLHDYVHDWIKETF